jgi:hypothetical protein
MGPSRFVAAPRAFPVDTETICLFDAQTERLIA